VLDEDKFINLNKLMAMLMDFVTRGLGWSGHVAIRSGTTSTALDDVISKLKTEGYDIETPECEQVNSLVQHPFYEVIYLEDKNNQGVIDLQKFPSIVTEVGFKYISAAMKKYNHPAAVAGEESGGFTIKFNPDKDGIVGVCLIASMIAWHGRKPSEIWEEHMKIYGKKYDKRLDVWVSNTPKEDLINSWLDNPPREIAGQKVLWVGGTRFDKVECILFISQSESPIISRLLVRASGTEDMIRVYMESDSEELLLKLENYVLNRIKCLIFKDIDTTNNYYELAEKVASNGLSFMNEWIRVEYFLHVKRKIDDLANAKEIRPEEIYREVLKQLTLLMDRDINIRHAAWGEDISIEYYRHIFRAT
jgi:phosphomannomutase